MTDDRAIAPLESLLTRDWWRQVDKDTWVVCADPAAERWCIWDRLTGTNTARRRVGDYTGADAAVRAAREK